MIASDPTPPLDKYFVQQIHQDLHLPLPEYDILPYVRS